MPACLPCLPHLFVCLLASLSVCLNVFLPPYLPTLPVFSAFFSHACLPRLPPLYFLISSIRESLLCLPVCLSCLSAASICLPCLPNLFVCLPPSCLPIREFRLPICLLCLPLYLSHQFLYVFVCLLLPPWASDSTSAFLACLSPLSASHACFPRLFHLLVCLSAFLSAYSASLTYLTTSSYLPPSLIVCIS